MGKSGTEKKGRGCMKYRLGGRNKGRSGALGCVCQSSGKKCSDGPGWKRLIYAVGKQSIPSNHHCPKLSSWVQATSSDAMGFVQG